VGGLTFYSLQGTENIKNSGTGNSLKNHLIFLPLIKSLPYPGEVEDTPLPLIQAM